MKLKIIFVLFGLILTTFSSKGSTTDTTNKKCNDVVKDGIFISFLTDFPIINIDDFNQKLMQNNEPNMGINFIFWGFSITHYYGPVLFNYGLTSSNRERNNNGYNTKTLLNSSFMNMGYDLVRHPNISFYPTIGWKGTNVSHSFSELMDVKQIDAFIENEFNSKSYNQFRNYIDLGINLSRQKVLRLNLSAGYMIPIFRERWRLNDQNSIRLKTDHFRQNFYFSFGIGLGSIFVKNECDSIEKFEYEEVPDWNPEL